jgi:poly-gamma-glutamate synthesis protein (capsule biosynthesis protein)
MSSPVVAAVGDVFLGGVLSENIKKYKKSFLSKDILKILNSADICFCNLESPLYDSVNQPEINKTLLCAKNNSIEFLVDSGMDVVSLANNHSMDFGWNALDDTINLLEMNGIKCIGAGKDLKDSRRPAIIDCNNAKVAFLAYSWTPPQFKEGSQAATHDSPGVSPYNLDYIRDDIKSIRYEADFIIISLHWGEEYTHYPSPDIISDAHSIIDSGADVIIGTHPHVLQGYERYGKGLVFYSLSNFLFSPWRCTHRGRLINYQGEGRLRRWYRESRESFILNLELGDTISWEIIPTLQRKDEPIVEFPPICSREDIMEKLNLWSSNYADSDYNKIHLNMRNKEKKFFTLKFILNEIETYGATDTLNRALKRLLRLNR